LRALALPGVEIRTAVQPQPEWAAEWAGYERVVLIDAALDGPAVSWEWVRCAGVEPGDGGTHHMEPAVVLGLARVLYGRSPWVSRWRIRGERFGIGEGLSASAAGAVEEAVFRIGRMLAGRAGAGLRDAQVVSETSV
jgi:hypothetical protein